MKNLQHYILLLVLCGLTFNRCANPGRPTGGPQDTIPPTLLSSTPHTGQINFNENQLELELSEYINADKIKQQLIITPQTNVKYKSIVRRNKLIVTLDEPLSDSTTYNFNFADAVVDITERNPAINLSVAFSTGPYIDSLSIKGTVKDLLSQDPASNFVVGLYSYTDTLDFLTTKPMYFTTANDSGNYNISYIKDGIYKILSFDDENGNYILDPESEAHAFLSDSINLKTEQTIKPLQALLQNIKPITLINARPAGQYAEIKFSREPFAYKLQPPYLYHNITGENKDIIRVYKPTSINYKDSIQAFLSTNDSLGNQILDTLKLVFLESKRKPATFSYSVQPTRITEGIDSTITLLFNKPIIQLDTTKFHFFSDSIFNYIPKADYVWNHNKTELAYTLLQKIDSIKQKFLQSIPADTTSIDSSLIAENPLAALQPTPNHTLEFEIEKGAFITVEQDTSDAKTLAIVEAPKPPTGLLRLQVETTQASYTIQLLKDNGTVAYQTNEINQNITFRNLSAATYTIRVLIDNNSDGKWSYGNLLKNQEPEQVYINPETVTIRENWELEMMITF